MEPTTPADRDPVWMSRPTGVNDQPPARFGAAMLFLSCSGRSLPLTCSRGRREGHREGNGAMSNT